MAKKNTDSFLTYFEGLIDNKGSSYKSGLIHLTEFSGGALLFSDITEQKIKEFLTFLHEKKNLKDNSINQYFTVLRAIINEAVFDGLIPDNPINKIKKRDRPKKQDSKREYLTIEELKKLNETKFPNKNTQIGQAFLFGCFAGMRISDIKLLKWSNLKNDKIEFFAKKTKRLEYLPISKSAQKILDGVEKKDGEDTVFWDLPKHDAQANRLLCDWAKAAGVDKHLHYHISRHSYSVLSISNGVDIFTLSKLLGHANVNTTQLYAKVSDAKKTEAVDKLPEL